MHFPSIVKKSFVNFKIGDIIWNFSRNIYIKYICLTPCKRLQKYGIGAIYEVHNILNKYKLPYFADYGTLLGIIREKGFIKHDDDIDFTIPPNSPSPREYMEILNKSKKLKFCWGFEYKGRITELTYSYKEIPIDFFFSCVEDGCIYDYVYIYTKGGAEWIPYRQKRMINNKFIKTVVNKQEVFIPDNYEEVLKTTYGNWRQPVDFSKNKDRYNISEAIPIEYTDGLGKKVDSIRVCEIG